MIKLLIGGSPCTYWSIAQKNNRETKASGMGWELFKNYLIAKEKFQPDFFLYENNKSAAQTIKDQIKKELKVNECDLFTFENTANYIEINSALVSAQNRQRFYVHNCGEVEQPKDRGILLKDILETTTDEMCYSMAEPVCVAQRGRMYCGQPQKYEARTDGKTNALTTVQKDNEIAEPINITSDGKSQTIKAQYAKNSVSNFCCYESTFVATGVAVPIKCLSDKEMDYMVGDSGKYNNRWSYLQKPNESEKSLCITANISKGVPYNVVAEPVRIGTIESEAKNKSHDSKQYRVYACDGKSTTICGHGGGVGAKTGLYAIPVMPVTEATEKGYTEIECGDCVDLSMPNSKTRRGRKMDKKCNCLTTSTEYYQYCGTIDKPIYEVKNGKITIKGKQHPIKLKDGYYIIRKLTVTECCRLQTMPDDYCRAVSNSQAYKGLGNGWTAEVIIHILNGALKDVPKDEEIVVLSMYDGIGTGRYCLDKMGFTNVKYYAYEIDKYAMKIATSNYPDIIQCGDAFKLREDNWVLGY